MRIGRFRQIDEIDAFLEAGFARHLEDPWLRPYADDDLPENWRKHRDAAWALIQPLVRAQPDTFLEAPRAKLIAEIVAQGRSNRFTLYRHLRRYWQRGMTPNALLPDYSNSGGAGKSKGASGKKRGRPPIHGIEGMNVTPEVRDCFRSSVQRYYANKNKLLPSDCYRRCLRDFFSEPVINPETGAQEFVIRPDHPTLAQFRYWLERDNDILDLDRKPLEVGTPPGGHHAVLGKMRAQGVDHLGALADEHLPCAEQHRAGLLVFRLQGNKAHGRTQRGVDDRFRIRRIVLLAFDERLHVHRRDQTNLVSQLLKGAAPAMGRRAGLHGHDASRLPGNEVGQLGARQLLAKRDRPIPACPVQMGNQLCNINPDDGNLGHGCSLFP